MNLSLLSPHYQPPQSKHWTGRATDPTRGSQYWYQEIELWDLSKGMDFSSLNPQPEIALIGYVCEEGVRRNLGRPGASQGPTVIRQQLGKVAWHGSKTIADVGDIVCQGEELETCQEAFSQVITHLIQQGIFPIGLGGGHDIAFAHFRGIWHALNRVSTPAVGIINFDAHLDLRPLTDRPNSGTPFYQILSEYEGVGYCGIGIQLAANTQELFQIAREKGVTYVLQEDCRWGNWGKVKQILEAFTLQFDHLYVTIDLDGFSSAYAPGVSAPSPVGLTPEFVVEALAFLFQTKKVIACDVAEMNPQFDQDHSTARLAARLIDVSCKLQASSD